MTERQLQTEVENLARLFGWRYYHTYDSRRSHSGFPDLVLIRPPRLIFAELKSAAGRTSTTQDEWLADLELVQHDLEHHGVHSFEVHVWRPEDLQEHVPQTLQRR